MIVKTLSVGQLQANCYVIGDAAAGVAAIVDPGGDASKVLAAADGLVVRYVIDTHAHFDHILGNREVMQGLAARQENAPELVLHAQESSLLVADGGASWFGFVPRPSPQPDLFVRDGDVLRLGALALRVLHTPGHSPGSISLYCASEGVLFSGDVLFRRGVGRTDLPGGDWSTLLKSISETLFALPDDTMVYPGHGPPTTIGEERRANPFLKGI